jgi:hypothetical protein
LFKGFNEEMHLDKWAFNKIKKPKLDKMGGVVANLNAFDVLGLHKYEGEFHFIIFEASRFRVRCT